MVGQQDYGQVWRVYTSPINILYLFAGPQPKLQPLPYTHTLVCTPP